MPPKGRRKVTGYVMYQEISRALRSNSDARQVIERLSRDRPDPQSQTYNVLMTRVALSLATNLEAIMEIQTILTDAGVSTST